MQLIAVCPPESSAEAAACGFTVAHACYRIEQGRLCLLNGACPKSGIMLIDAAVASERCLTDALSESIVNECKKRRFSGVFIDFPKNTSINPEIFSKNGLEIYLPDCACGGVHAVISSAVSVGNYEKQLRFAAKNCGRFAPALGLEFTRVDFTLPDKTGHGRELSRKELISLFNSKRSRSFFSEELCACYFRYSENGRNHLVLFDNEHSVMRKLAAAENLGFEKAFFYYPEFRSMRSVISFQNARPCE